MENWHSWNRNLVFKNDSVRTTGIWTFCDVYLRSQQKVRGSPYTFVHACIEGVVMKMEMFARVIAVDLNPREVKFKGIADRLQLHQNRHTCKLLSATRNATICTCILLSLDSGLNPASTPDSLCKYWKVVFWSEGLNVVDIDVLVGVGLSFPTMLDQFMPLKQC
jgi:hypothetical protein